MDSIRFIPKHELDTDIDKLKFPILTDEDKRFLNHFICCVHLIQEVQQHFYVYRVSLDVLRDTFELNNRDEIIYKGKPLKNDINYFHLINAITINLISSGKTLVDRVETLLHEIDVVKAARFKSDVISNEYDNNFSYRLMCYLRNQAQHGDLPVSVYSFQEKQYMCFDIFQIINTKHLKTNKATKEILKNVTDKLHGEGLETRIAYTLSIAEYNCSIAVIYNSLFSAIRNDIVVLKQQLDTIIVKVPELLIKADIFPDGTIAFLNDEDIIETILLDEEDDVIHMVDEFSKSAKCFRRFEKNALTKFKQSIRRRKVLEMPTM